MIRKTDFIAEEKGHYTLRVPQGKLHAKQIFGLKKLPSSYEFFLSRPSGNVSLPSTDRECIGVAITPRTYKVEYDYETESEILAYRRHLEADTNIPDRMKKSLLEALDRAEEMTPGFRTPDSEVA